MSGGAVAVARGCGTRKAGGIYAELGVTNDGSGQPVEVFLIDPPRSIENLTNVTAVGVTAIEVGGVTHVIDWIGATHYPEVPDFVEEVRRFGLSRRLPKTFPFAKLTPESRLLCVHPKAWIDEESCGIIRPGMADDGPRHYCPTLEVGHTLGGNVRCVWCCWEAVKGGLPEEPDETGGQRVGRTMPSFSYHARRIPDGLEPEYRPAIFASFPLSRIAVVRAAGGTHQDAVKRARASHLRVDEVDE